MIFLQRHLFPLLALLIGCVLIATFSPLKAVGIFVATGMIALTIFRPEWALLFLAVLIPFEPFLLKWVPNELYVYARYFSEVVVYVLFLVAFFRTVFLKKSWGPKDILVPIAFLLAAALASWAINLTPAHVAVLGLRQIIRFMLLVFIAYQLGCSLKFLKRLLVALGACVVFESGLGILQWLSAGALDAFLLPEGRRVFADIQLTTGTTQFWEPGERVFGTLGRYDQLGTFLSLMLLLFAGIFFEVRKKIDFSGFFAYILPAKVARSISLREGLLRKVAQISKKFLPVSIAGFFLIVCFALLLTYSRASWFGFLLGIFVIGVVLKRSRLLSILCAGSIAIVLISLLSSWNSIARYEDVPRQSIGHRILEAFSYERWRGEYLDKGRLYFFIHTPTDVVARAPLFGVGLGSYGAGTAAALHYTEQYEWTGMPFGIHGTEGYIDNNWFSLWGELGTIGLLAYLAIFFTLLRFAWRVYKNSPEPLMRGVALGYIGVLTAVFFQAFLATYLEVRTLAFYLWLFGGIIVTEALRLRRATV